MIKSPLEEDVAQAITQTLLLLMSCSFIVGTLSGFGAINMIKHRDVESTAFFLIFFGAFSFIMFEFRRNYPTRISKILIDKLGSSAEFSDQRRL